MLLSPQTALRIEKSARYFSGPAELNLSNGETRFPGKGQRRSKMRGASEADFFVAHGVHFHPGVKIVDVMQRLRFRRFRRNGESRIATHRGAPQ